MPKSFNRIWVHAIWATKNRRPLIDPSMDEELHNYIMKKFNEVGCQIRISNGYHDHVHCLFLLNPKRPLDEIIQRVKGSSSHFVNSNNLIRDKFAWQRGYRSFSVSESINNRVYQYILNQKKHHEKKKFIDEYKSFLRIHNLDAEGDELLK
jgi:REP element-mobilizing transposase RayT